MPRTWNELFSESCTMLVELPRQCRNGHICSLSAGHCHSCFFTRFLFPMYSVVEHPILKTTVLSPFSRLKEFLLIMSYLVPFVTLGTVCLNCCDHKDILRVGLQKLLVPDHLLTLIHLIDADWTSAVTKFPSYWKAHSEEAYCLYPLMNVTAKISSCGLFLAYLSSPKVFNSTRQTHNTRVSFCIKNLTLHWFSSTTDR